ERARPGIQELKKGVEHAAESVIGDDTESLRLAQKQLDDLTNQLQREISDARGGESRTNAPNSTEDGGVDQASQRQAGAQPSQASDSKSARGSTGKGSEPGQAQTDKSLQAKNGNGQQPGQDDASQNQQDSASESPTESESASPGESSPGGRAPGQ